jgi:hypothetical protein
MTSRVLLTLRRLVLAGSGAVFALIAVAAIVRPSLVAARYGLTLDGVEAMNEFRAVFVGFWLALAAMMLTAARRPSLGVLGDLCGLALLLQAAGRLLSVALDGVPRTQFVAAMIGEAVAGAIVLAARPAPRNAVTP